MSLGGNREFAVTENIGLPAGGLDQALELMEQALEILDSNECPADVGAHLDLAINRLRASVGLG